MKKVLVIGTIFRETQFFIDSTIVPHTAIISTDFIEIFGSKAMNAARTLSALGLQVDFIGRINKKDNDNFQEFTKSKKIDSSKLQLDDEVSTGQIAVVTDDNPEASQFLYIGANKNLAPNQLDVIDYSYYDAIYSVTSLPDDFFYKLLDKCLISKVPLYLDFPSKHKEIKKESLKNVDFLIPNRYETELFLDTKISSQEDAEKALKKLREFTNGTVIITLDADGSICLPKDTDIPIIISHDKGNPIDTTAAGDIYRASFMAYNLVHNDIQKSLEFASKVAGWSTTIKGVNHTLDQLGSKFSL